MQGRWKDAEALELQVLETRQRVRGAEHYMIVGGMNNLDRHEEAIAMMPTAVCLRTAAPGADQPHTYTSMCAVS